MLATVTEDSEVAERHLTAALATSRAAGSPPYEAISRVQFARLQLARRGPGDGPAAAANLDAALRIADRLGMAPLAAEARALRAQTPVLSIREEQVAALVAEGLSNRQIAGRLGLSERTAENHVTHILTKLGFDSRARIASWYAKH
jgi:DNA-binding CsgD family transcriptional regulator